MADTPTRAGFLQASGGYSWLSGPFVRGELGAKLRPGLSVFSFGEWNKVEPMAGAGLRWEFNW